MTVQWATSETWCEPFQPSHPTAWATCGWHPNTAPLPLRWEVSSLHFISLNTPWFGAIPKHSRVWLSGGWKERVQCHTHPGPLPDEGNRWLFTEEERGVTGRKVWILKEDPPAQAFLLQLLIGLPRAVCGACSARQRWRPRLQVTVQVGHGSFPPAREIPGSWGLAGAGRKRRGSNNISSVLWNKGQRKGACYGELAASSSPPPPHLSGLQYKTNLPLWTAAETTTLKANREGKRLALVMLGVRAACWCPVFPWGSATAPARWGRACMMPPGWDGFRVCSAQPLNCAVMVSPRRATRATRQGVSSVWASHR